MKNEEKEVSLVYFRHSSDLVFLIAQPGTLFLALDCFFWYFPAHFLFSSDFRHTNNMAFRKQDWIFVGIVVAVVFILAALSYFGPHPPAVPPIPAHQSLTSQTTRVECLVCHDPEKGQPPSARLTIRHPQKWRDEKFSCLGCHKIQRATAK